MEKTQTAGLFESRLKSAVLSVLALATVSALGMGSDFASSKTMHHERISSNNAAPTLVQAGGADEEPEVTPIEVEKYIAVYKAMQKNHDLTVDQAAAQQGLTVGQFRKIEMQVERDDLIRERVRRALRPQKPGAPS